MKNYIQSLINRSNVIRYLFLIIIGGMICGVLLSQWLDKEVLSSLSSNMYATIISTNVNQKDLFVSQFTTNIILCILVLFLGFSLLGIPFISFIVFTKGVQIGFSCAMYIITYQLKGMIGIILTLIPQVAIDAIAIFIMSTIAFELSFLLLKRSFILTPVIQWKELIDKKMNYVLISFSLVLLSSTLKATIILFLMELFALIQ